MVCYCFQYDEAWEDKVFNNITQWGLPSKVKEDVTEFVEMITTTEFPKTADAATQTEKIKELVNKTIEEVTQVAKESSQDKVKNTLGY